MKKILLTSAVLVGMGAYQAFAADTDSWEGLIQFQAEDRCAIHPDPNVTLGSVAKNDITTGVANGATFDDDETQAGIDANDNGLADQAFTVSVLFDGQTYCNYAHEFELLSQYNGFTVDKTTAEITAFTTYKSDAFLTGIPYTVALTADSWHSQVVTAVTTTTQPAYAAVVDYTDGTVIDWTTATTTATTIGTSQSSVPAFHNDGQSGTGDNTTDGLEIVLTYTPDTTAKEDEIPYLSGTYSERLFLEIGDSI